MTPHTPPSPAARFAEKRRYYRSQHTSRGIRATHLVGIPAIVLSLPLLLVRPKLGLKLFCAGWGLQIFGHVVYEKNSPALRNGPVSYELVGLAYWSEEMTDMIASWNARRSVEWSAQARPASSDSDTPDLVALP